MNAPGGPTSTDGSARLPLILAMLAREQGITGVHTHVTHLRDHLAREGVACRLVTPRTWARSPWRRVLLLTVFAVSPMLERLHASTTHVRWYRRSHEFFLYLALRRELASAGACVVYAQCPASARAALRARCVPEQRVVLAVHFVSSQADEWALRGYIPPNGRTFRRIRRLEQEVLPAVDGLVFVSNWARTALLAWLPQAGRVPSRVVTNFVPGSAPRQRQPRRADLVTVGNLLPVKNHGYLLRILAEAKRQGYRYTLDIFGEGMERPNLSRLAHELGLADRVRFLGFQPDVAEQLPAYDAYVHTSYSESSCIAVMEAMAAGLPVVTTESGALAELLDDPDQGRYWPIDEPARAAEILVGLLASEAERARAGRAARARFERDYAADVVVPRLLAFMDGVQEPMG
ncbi:MAG TPA: glycosyltransferase [Intrasporangium sp.]|nr:glycosyltransferase [Intrasporangium sp.]